MIISNRGNGANLRARPAGLPLVELLSDGTAVDALPIPTVMAALGTTMYIWQAIRVQADNAIGWVVANFLANPAPQPGNLIGLHFLEDAQNQASQILASSTKIASATVVDNATIANVLAQSGVPYVLFRRWPDNQNLAIPDDPVAAEAYGRQWVINRFNADSVLATINGCYLDLVNEVTWTPGHPGFWLGVLKQLSAYGKRGAMGCYGVGYPEPAQWATAQPALEYAKANGHIVCLHSYCAPNTPLDQLSADSADYELRFARLYNAVPVTAWPVLILGECAHQFSRGAFEGTAHLIKFAQIFQDAVRQYPYLKGFNLWTVGSYGGWQSSDITTALPALETFISTGYL